MAELIQIKSRRLIHPDDIEWLTIVDRLKARREIKKYTDIVMALDERLDLTPDQVEVMQMLTSGSTNIDTWGNAAYETMERVSKEYYDKLKVMAQHDLTAYHEYMNPDEFPAPHHVWLCERLMKVESGAIRTFLLSAPPGSAKPIAFCSRVLMGDGSLKQIKDVEVGDYVIGKSGKACRVLAVHAQGRLPITEVVAASGRKLALEGSHLCLTNEGWKEARALFPDRDLLARVAAPVFSRPKATVVEIAAAALAGYLVGDGCVSTTAGKTQSKADGTPHVTQQCSFTNGDMLAIKHVETCAALLGFKCNRRERHGKTLYYEMNISGANQWLRETGLAGKVARTKRVPDFVMDGGPELWAAFIGAYWTCDGTVYSKAGRGRNTFHIAAELSSVSRELLDDVQLLLGFFGIDARVSEHTTNYVCLNGKKTVSYKLVSRTVHDVYRLKRALEAHMPTEKGARFAKFDYRQTRFDGLYLPDRVATVTLTDREEECYCLTVEGDASFVAEGFVVHNSSYGSRSFVQWAMGRNPNWRVLMGGYNQTFSDNEFSKANRDAIMSDRYREVFPDIFVSESDRAMDSWKLEGVRGKYYSRGAGAGVAGVRSMLTNLDDPIGKAETAASQGERDKLWRWMTTDILPRRLPGNRMVIIATRWFSDDIIGRLEALYKEKPEAIIGPVEIVNIPAQAGKDDPLGRVEGEWLWERNSDGTPHYTAQHYETLRLTMPPGDWSALYMGIPLDQKGEYIGEDQFQRYDRYPQNVAGRPNEVLRTVVSVDTAQKANERSDYTAITVWRTGVDKKHYLVYAQRVKITMDKLVPLLNKIGSNWNANYFLIEDAGMGSQIIQNYQGKMIAPIVEFSPYSRSSKDFAFDGTVPYITSGLMLFPKLAPWLTEYINELVAFSGDNDAHDDYVDSTSQYAMHVLKKRGGGGTKKLKMRT